MIDCERRKIMANEIKLRIKSGVLALAVAGGITLTNPPKVYAEEVKPHYTQGTFLEDQMEYEESQYGRYVVKKGDNISSISQKICRRFGEDTTTKYWPVLAFLNGFPRVIQPGDIIIFPATFEDMDQLLQDLKETGWTSRYIQQNDVYGKKKKAQKRTTVGELIAEIYGEEACTDPDFVRRYLQAQGLSGKYTMDSEIEGTNMLFELTEWIPTLEELGYNSLKTK